MERFQRHRFSSGVGLAEANPYRYADYRYDAASGLYYLMARWYDASTGRFLSPAPAAAIPSYTYAGIPLIKLSSKDEGV